MGQGRAFVTPTLLAFNRGNTKHTGDGCRPRSGALRRLHRRRPESSEAPPPEPALRVSLQTVGVSAAHLDVALGSPWGGLSHDPCPPTPETQPRRGPRGQAVCSEGVNISLGKGMLSSQGVIL